MAGSGLRPLSDWTQRSTVKEEPSFAEPTIHLAAIFGEASTSTDLSLNLSSRSLLSSLSVSVYGTSARIGTYGLSGQADQHA